MAERELKSILLVEDEKDIRDIAVLAMEMVGGMKVTACESGSAALEIIDAVKPDLVMLDVMMPEMDGPTALKKLRLTETGKDVPVVFLTARVQEAEVNEYIELGAVAVIPKPFDPMTLAETVKGVWRQKVD